MIPGAHKPLKVAKERLPTRSIAKQHLQIELTSEYRIMCNLDMLSLDWSVQYYNALYCVVFQGTKAIMKDVARFLPGIGWTFLFMEYPFLKRDWAHDEGALIESCHNLRDYPVNMLVSEYLFLRCKIL